MNYGIIEKEVKAYVTELHLINEGRSLPFHNITRTTEVVKVVKKIAGHYHLDDKSHFIAVVAAWFSQCGYVIDTWDNATMKGIEVASAFLKQAQLPEEDITGVTDCIKAGAGIIKPAHFTEVILSDANTYYLGTPDFRGLNKLLRKEKEMVLSTVFTSADWTAISIEMLEKHEYFSDYCRSLLDLGKKDNLLKLKSKQFKLETKTIENQLPPKREPAIPVHAVAMDVVPKKPKVEKEKTPVRGIETMFRTSSTNNVRISIMADNKANIMITVNSIIISVVLGLIVKNLESQRYMIIPSLILLTVNVVTIIYSVLATRPNIGPGVFTPEQVEDKSINMLYFGSFYNMGFDDYTSAMKKVIMDTDFLYGCLMKDLYWQGKVLGRKYKLLRKAYTTFLFGIIASVLAFAIAGMFFS
ncbi:MAG: Pycsar system effector family protein [Bacteroidota bacterium]